MQLSFFLALKEQVCVSYESSLVIIKERNGIGTFIASVKL